MKIIAIYNLKGGVGKSSMAVNLAAESAQASARRTLLWDLDPQGASSYLLSDAPAKPGTGRGLFDKSIRPDTAAIPSRVDGVDIIPSDFSMRGIDRYLASFAGKRRLAKLLERLEGRYDRLILDCPPGLSDLSEQVLRAAHVVIVPVVPSALSQRAFADMVAHVRESFGKKEQVAMLPVHSMVDRRRKAHLAALLEQPDWPIIPYASVIEQMSERREPLRHFAARSAAQAAYAALWRGIERKLES